MAFCQPSGGMLAGAHDVDEDAQSVDICALIGLRHAILFRRGKSGCTKNYRIAAAAFFIKARSVKVNY